MTHHVEHNTQGTLLYHGFSLLISVECACVEHYPWVYSCTQWDVWKALPPKWSDWLWTSCRNLCVSPKSHSQPRNL